MKSPAAKSTTTASGPSHATDPLLRFRRPIATHALQQLLYTTAEAVDVRADTPTTVHDFTRIPVHSKAPVNLQATSATRTPGDIHEDEADHLPTQAGRAHEPLPQDSCASGGGHRSGKKQHDLKLQTKLAISTPGDEFEQEADRVADQVLAEPTNHVVSSTPPRIQRLTGQTDGQTDTAPASVHRVLAGHGRPLGPGLQQDMEQRFGHDFSRVRVHSGTAAEQSAREMNANAYTARHNIVFGASRFAPSTYEGRKLIAHELTHVVHQTGSDGSRIGLCAARSGMSPIGAGANENLPMTAERIQLQYGSDKTTGIQAPKHLNSHSKNTSTGKTQPSIQTPIAISAGMKSRDEILATLRSLKSQLQAIPKSREDGKSIAKSVTVLQNALLSAPIEPTPKRDFIRGPIHFSETYKTLYTDDKDPNFFSFNYTSMDDKAWETSWTAIYELAAGPFGIVISLCEAIFGESDNDRSFDKAGNENVQRGKVRKFVREEGKHLPSIYLEHGVATPLEKVAERYGTKDYEVFAKWATSLAFAIDAALTAYKIYEANTQGPSLHRAAVETAARVMGRAFNWAGNISMNEGQGGEFIPHPGGWSEVRVARHPRKMTPLPQLKDRRLAYDMVGNRVYEMMMNVLTPEHLASPAAFYKFRNARIENAENIVGNADATIVEMSEKFGGKMLLVTETKSRDATRYEFEIGKVRE